MDKGKRSADIQILKTPSGDAMMVVHIDKENLGRMVGSGAVLGIFEELEPKGGVNLPKCLVRFDKFRITEDLIIEPGFSRIG